MSIYKTMLAEFEHDFFIALGPALRFCKSLGIRFSKAHMGTSPCIYVAVFFF